MERDEFHPETAMPGKLIGKDQQQYILHEFSRRFCGGKLPERKPAWLAFPTSERRTLASGVMGTGEVEYFNSIGLKGELDLLILVDPLPRLIFRTSLDQIRKYLSDRQPSEDYDLCIFPESLAWCLAITHLQCGGMVDVFGMGDLPRSLLIRF